MPLSGSTVTIWKKKPRVIGWDLDSFMRRIHEPEQWNQQHQMRCKSHWMENWKVTHSPIHAKRMKSCYRTSAWEGACINENDNQTNTTVGMWTWEQSKSYRTQKCLFSLIWGFSFLSSLAFFPKYGYQIPFAKWHYKCHPPQWVMPLLPSRHLLEQLFVHVSGFFIPKLFLLVIHVWGIWDNTSSFTIYILWQTGLAFH